MSGERLLDLSNKDIGQAKSEGEKVNDRIAELIRDLI